ncbi:GDP-mannose 4,6-dehydratase [Candidatus Micrarchaeota archaeon]|nr:GDP-mannose 4,6-dehydratase [Candidatus Micrarchaeota archaeon]
MRVLVTGAAGLYGVHTVERLCKRDDVERVIGVDDLSRNFLDTDPFQLVDSPEVREKFEFIKMDFRGLDNILLNKLDVDVVIHYAAYVSIPESMEVPDKYFEVNELGTFNLCQNLLATRNQPFLIYASSPEVYGTPIMKPMDIDHPMYPRSFYAVTKLAAEKHCHVLHQWYNYPVAIVRNFNTFGENQNVWSYSAVICNFIMRALRNEPLIIHNDGRQTRDFLYVKDAVRAYEMIVEKRKQCKGEIFNIGTGKETSISDLADIIIRLTHSHSGKEYSAGRSADLAGLCADISRAREKIGWMPEYSLEDGLLRTIDWYSKYVQKGA